MNKDLNWTASYVKLLGFECSLS